MIIIMNIFFLEEFSRFLIYFRIFISIQMAVSFDNTLRDSSGLTFNFIISFHCIYDIIGFEIQFYP
jgi:hypothetical protein